MVYKKILRGILLAVVLAAGGFILCSLIFGKENTVAVLVPKDK